MKRSTHWLVADEGIRPAGPPDRCFYCNEEQGKEHKEGCVIRSRTIVVRFTVDLVVDVPESWTTNEIDFYYNDGSRCSNNLIGDLSRLRDRTDGCICPFVHAEFVREADEDDEQEQALRVNELPN